MKDMHFDSMEREKHQLLALALGLTYEELDELNYEIDENTSEDGVFYSYVVSFIHGSNQEILDKIDRLEMGKFVYLEPSELELSTVWQDELEWEISFSRQLEVFHKNMKSIDILLELEVDGHMSFNLLVIAHAYIITATEHFLSSTFMHTISNSPDLTRKFVENEENFGKEKLTLSDIFKKYKELPHKIASYLQNISFHNVDVVKRMYKSVLDFDFGDIDWLREAVVLRHDCVHRAGYSKENKRIEISRESIKTLKQQCVALCENVNDHVFYYNANSYSQGKIPFDSN